MWGRGTSGPRQAQSPTEGSVPRLPDQAPAEIRSRLPNRLSHPGARPGAVCPGRIGLSSVALRSVSSCGLSGCRGLTRIRQGNVDELTRTGQEAALGLGPAAVPSVAAASPVGSREAHGTHPCTHHPDFSEHEDFVRSASDLCREPLQRECEPHSGSPSPASLLSLALARRAAFP